MVKLNHVVKSFSGEKDAAVKGISLDIREGEFLTILGPSGCGKTTTLRMIAGFEQADSGSVLIDNKDVSSKAPYERDVNTVFQNYALFPHLDVFDNVAFGLTIKKLNKHEIRTRVMNMLKIVQMEGYENRMPDQLSGGQKQRVAIARAVINNPKVLLLDEPLGALDQKLRKQMQIELKHLQKKLGITFVFVTHDQEEAMTMSDRICVMNNGLIEQVGTPEEIYENPETRFVADFIGETNIFEGTVENKSGNSAVVRIEDGQIVNLVYENINMGDKVCFAVRPERLKLNSSSDTGLEISLKERTYIGSVIKTIVTLSNGREITISEPAGERFAFNDEAMKAYVTWNPENAVVMKS
jgi:spermidine/putrescine transport system ATP-binding protein